MAHRPPGKPDFIVGDSLADIFAEAGIHLGRSSPSPGRNLKVVCPKCNGGRTKEPSLSIKVDDDGQGAAWQCHRGNCPGFRGNGRVESSRYDDEAPRAERESKPVEPPKPAKAYTAAQQENRSPVYGWAEKRGISRETVDWFGLFVTDAWFPQHQAERPAIAFPYRWQGKVVGHKYRDIEKTFAQDPGTTPTLFNVDSLESPDVLHWVEGECFPADAEVLTPRGWVRFPDLTGGDLIAQWDRGHITFRQPISYVRKAVTGLLTRWDSKGYCSVTTPGHALIRRDPKGRLGKVRADEMRPTMGGVIPRVGLCDGSGVDLSDEQLRLCVAIAADAALDERTGRSRYQPAERRYARFALTKARKIDRLRALLSSLGIAASDEAIASGEQSICFPAPEWVPGKRLPWAWIADLSARQREVIIGELRHWDGNTVPNRDQDEFATKHQDVAAWVQALAHTSNRCSSIIKRRNEFGEWLKVSLLHGKRHTTVQYLHRRDEPYSGDVFCVSMPAGALLVRQEGKVTVSGNCDVMALHEAGYRQIVSLRDGAPAEIKDEDDPRRADDKRFAALTTHADALKPVKKVILACDNDGPGMNLREELARRLGKARCWIVSWPEGCKDAGDVLRLHGPEKLRACIEAAEPWPMKGMVRVDAARLLQHRERGRLVRGQVCGIKALDEVVKMPVEGGRLITIVGVPAHGKALALDTEIPTPDGMRLMGDLAVGDAVFAPDGMPTRIIAATDVMEGRPCYRLRFDDGTEVIADADHLWVTRDDKARRSAIVAKQKRGDRDWTMPGATDQRWKRTFPSAKTTAEIAATLRVHGNGRFNHVVRLAAPAQGMQRKFDIPPYVLGVWLGDGSTSCAVVTCHDKDKQILDELGQAGFPTKRRGGAKWAHAVGLSSEMDDLRGLQERLRDLGVLGNKHVPEMYLTASADQRLALLQGLMDTDGYVHPGGQAEFCSINEALSKAAFRIIASLGMKPAICVGRAAVNGKDCGPKYRVMYYPTLPVFRLRRKADRLAASLRKSRPRLLHRTIIAADRVESVPVRCIQVSHSSGEFLITKAHIPTHNSSFVRDWVTRIAAKHGRKAVWVSPEDGSVDVVAEQMAQVYAGGPFWPGPTQQLTNAEIDAAGRFIADHFTFLATDDPDDEMTVDWLLNLADIAVARHGADLLVADPWNELEHSRAKGESETEYAGRTLKRLKAWGRSRGVDIILVVHPPKLQVDPKTRKMPMPTGYDVASSAHFFNKTDVGLTIWRPTGAVATEVHVWKAKYSVWGKRGSFATLQFDAITGRFKSAGFELGDQPVTPTRWAEDPPEEAE